MTNFLNHLWRIILSSIALYIVWVFSLSIAETFVEADLKNADSPELLSAVLLFVVCFINSGILYITVINSRWTGIRLIFVIFSLLFFIQFFLSMIEAIWFNNSLHMPISGVYYILIVGLIMSVIYAPLIVWIGLKIKPENIHDRKSEKLTFNIVLLYKILFLIVIVYPMIYNLAGYYIAWQFEAVRIYYSNSSAIYPFVKMLWTNVVDGLYTFQIIRGAIWLTLGLTVYKMINGSYIKKGIIIGLLFAFLMNSQHLIPNPYFPREVALAHFIETASSNFIWGFFIAWFIQWNPGKKKFIPS